MQHQYTNRANRLTIPADFEDYTIKQAGKLNPILESFPQDGVILHVILDEANHMGDVKVQLRLSLPGQIITSHEAGALSAVRSTYDTALKDLRRQLLAYKEQR